MSSRIELTRRSLFKYMAGAAAAGTVPELLSACAAPVEEKASHSEEALNIGPIPVAAGASYVIARASDGLDMRLDLFNLQVNAANKVVPINGSQPGYFRLHMHTQHVSEAVPTRTQFGNIPQPDDIASRSAGESRLVLVVPPAFPGVDFKLDTLLNLFSTLQINIAANAISDGLAPAWYTMANAASNSGKPTDTVTALEIPFRLQLSPNEKGRFVHSNPPAPTQNTASSGRVELFNSRLAVANAAGLPDERATSDRTVRALYAREPARAFDPANEGLDALPGIIRTRIASQSSAFTNPAILPRSIPVDNLVLTPYGGTLQANGNWEGMSGAGLISWKHRTSIGRDAYIHATLIGYVMPFGLRAAVTVTTQRLYGRAQGYVELIQDWELQLLETTRDFSTQPGLPLVGHRGVPFQRVVARQTTFAIDPLPDASTKHDPQSADPNGVQGSAGPKVAALSFQATAGGGARQLFVPMTAIDRRGRHVTFDAPLFWICADSLSDIAAKYNSIQAPTTAGLSTPQPSNLIALGRQRVALAPSTKDHTTVEAVWMAFNAVNVPTAGANGAMTNTIYPYVASMCGVTEAARNLGGLKSGSAVIMQYDKSYAPTPSPSNITSPSIPGVETIVNGIVQAAETQTLVNFPPISLGFGSAAQAGGLAAPSSVLGAIGLTKGLAGSPSDIASAIPNWSQLFQGAKLFGQIDLATFAQAAGLTKPPAFIAEAYSTAERYAAELELLADTGKGVLNAIADTNSIVCEHLATLRTALDGIRGAITSPATANLTTLASQIDGLPSSLTAIDGALATVGAPLTGVARAARQQLAKVTSAVQAGSAVIAKAITLLQQGQELARDQKAKIEWHSTISGGTPVPASGPFTNLITLGGASPSNFSLSVEMNGKAGTLSTFCSLDNFTLNFPPGNRHWVQLHFDLISVKQESGKKTEIDVKFDGLDFLDCLKFIESIESLIPLDGFSDPPHVDVTEQGITAGFSFALPNVAAGVLSFENMKLSAELNVPFLGDAITFDFDFCDRDHPFLVTIAFLGGGGYFNLTLASRGDGDAIRKLEGSIFVAAEVAIDLVVASGSLSARAGITLGYESGVVSITAFVDLRGAMQVLGLISASIEAYVGLTYDSSNTLSGTCKLIIDIDIAFISKSVTLEFHQSFWGGAPKAATGTMRMAEEAPLALPAPMLSPTFADVFTDTVNNVVNHDRWTSYCSYFA